MKDATKVCAKCGKEIEPLTEFPNRYGAGVVCLACYEATYDATPREEYDTIMQAFGGGR